MPPIYKVYIDGTAYSYVIEPMSTWKDYCKKGCFTGVVTCNADGYVYSTDGTKQLFDASNNPVKSTDEPDNNANYYLVALTPPSAHHTLIAGTSYKITKGKTLAGGTAYSIIKGRTLVGGTGYDLVLTPPVQLITFTVLGSYSVSGTYTAEEGMTYRDWVYSEYNDAGFYLDWGDMGQYIVWSGSNGKGLFVDLDKTIIDGDQISIEMVGPT